MFELSQLKYFQFLRLLSTKNALKIVGFINRKMNITKAPKLVSYETGHSKIELNYKDEFRARMSRHVCDWNTGI